jgi:hypothetical protein
VHHLRVLKNILFPETAMTKIIAQNLERANISSSTFEICLWKTILQPEPETGRGGKFRYPKGDSRKRACLHFGFFS